MKKYFQKLYNETGQKPFTFLNCFLCVFTPIIALILGYMIDKVDPTPAIILLIVVTILSLAANVFILFKRFNDIKRALLLALLNNFASLHFFCKLILFPLIKIAFRFAGAATQMQMGNTAGASHTMGNATASAGIKTSAFNWFKYDGTTIADHLEDEELFMAAMQTMKMTGQLTDTALLMKPSMWSQMIKNFYVRIGYQYSSDYGVDMQLMELANEQGKTILNVESGEEQMQLLTDYSDAVQQMLLISALSIDPLTYNEGIDEMFESWCAGDEEVLRQLIVEDTSQLTQEELAVYEEYKQAMNTDRDAHMLEVAKGYLESGETVFYAVGLAHLLSEEGLVNTLRQAGYTVEKVTYS